MSDYKQNKELRVCKRCHRMFWYYGAGYGYCEICTPIDNQRFHEVKDYIWEHGTASALEVSQALNISIEQIYTYLKEGRLEVPEDSPIYIHCEKCGKDIRYGRFCQECGFQIRRDFKGTLKVEPNEIGESPKGKIRYDGLNNRF